MAVLRTEPCSLEIEGNRAALVNIWVGFVGSEFETLVDCYAVALVDALVLLPPGAATVGHSLALLGAPPAAGARAHGAPLGAFLWLLSDYKSRLVMVE